MYNSSKLFWSIFFFYISLFNTFFNFVPRYYAVRRYLACCFLISFRDGELKCAIPIKASITVINLLAFLSVS